ncbi:MAG: hypothetical protein HYX96_08715 [Chloroflexi bacterium]|nr:hypothetical protein [Chloroflexota bacterium]
MKKVWIIGSITLALGILIGMFVVPLVASGAEGAEGDGNWEAMHESCLNGDWEAMRQSAGGLSEADLAAMPCHGDLSDAELQSLHEQCVNGELDTAAMPCHDGNGSFEGSGYGGMMGGGYGGMMGSGSGMMGW